MKQIRLLASIIVMFSSLVFTQPDKLLEDSNDIELEKVYVSSGTGFFISEDGHIITSYHIVDDAKSISVEINLGDSIKEYEAKVIAKDVKNDLVLLKINFDNNNFNTIPFRITKNDSELGSAVFTLGFPMVDTMGKSIKLNTGVISSTCGFMGNNHTYQISVPINPGNSGGPLFDENGNLVGVIKSIYSGAENVAYAVKSKHVSDLCMKYLPQKEINMSNTRKAFVDHVKSLKNVVCLVIVTS